MAYNKLLIIITLMFASMGYAQESVVNRTDWEKYFQKYKAEGTIVVVDERTNPAQTLIYNEARASKRFSPASTFKIPHALFALDAGVIKDEFQIFKWDGVEHSYAGHNQDQDLRSAMRNSTVWVFSTISNELGVTKAKQYLKAINYGNADPACDDGDYWIDGNLKISAIEQIEFLKQLYQNRLPFQVEDQRLVKDVMINEAGNDWILRAKTGWEGRYGWWIGWVEWPSGPVFFALNIDTPNRLDDLYKRKAISRSILRSIGALPANE